MWSNGSKAPPGSRVEIDIIFYRQSFINLITQFCKPDQLAYFGKYQRFIIPGASIGRESLEFLRWSGLEDDHV